MGAEEYQQLKQQLDRIERFSLIKFKDILTIEEASIYTGLSKGMLYDMTSKNKITYFKPGGKTIYIEKTELDRWMKQGCIRSNRALEIEAANRLYIKNHSK